VTNRQGFLEKHHFLVRRLHSLTGIVPIGVFLIAHLVTNSSLAWGKFGLRADGVGMGVQDGGYQYFQKEVAWINTQVPHLLLIEITLWVSIAFHSVLGLYYARTGRSNTARYAYQDNWHVATLRWGWTFLVPGGTKWSHNFSVSTLVAAVQGSPEGWTAAGVVVAIFYFLGVSLLVFHFANGLWTAAITWGLTISSNAQKRWGYVCFALGIGLMGAAWSALVATFIADYQDARAVEERLVADKYGQDKLRELIEKSPRPDADSAPSVSVLPPTDQD
jgi:succinate dehydrogenase / fumarate reductase, cytochrome b subunit